MANSIIDIQLSIPSAVASPLVVGDRRLTLINLAEMIRAGVGAGLLNNLKGAGAYLQVQPTLVAASATATCAAVVDADTVTIAGTALTATQKRATGTVTCATAIVGNTITVNGQVFTAVAGVATPGAATFSIDTGDTATATSIAAQVNAYGGALVSGIVAARSAADVVTLYAVNQGTAGNAITLASSGGTLAVSGATLTGGAAIGNNAFDFAGTDNTTAAALAAAINASTTAAVKQVTATAANAVVTVTSKVAGLAGNTLTFVSSNGTRLAVTGSGLLASGSAGAVTRWAL